MTTEEDSFYRHCAELASMYARTRNDREKYFRETPCDIMAAVCMDERERDFGETTGLPFGTPHLIETAGNKIGQINLGIDRLITKAMRHATDQKRRVLLFFVTHSSCDLPDTDSCAAWAHDTHRAMLAAEQQVWQFNHTYGERVDMAIARPLIAMHLHSYTDLESKCWYNGKASLDPLFPVARFMGRFPFGGAEEFRRSMLEIGLTELGALFPPEDPRFAGLDAETYQRIIRQCADMFAANAAIVRDVREGKREASKGGHQGRRILIGDWPLHTQAGAYFKISDYVPDPGTELGIAFKYVLRNTAMACHESGNAPHVPIHVNLQSDGEGETAVCKDRVISIARLIRREVTDLLANPFRNQVFWKSLCHVSGDESPPGLSPEALAADPAGFFRIHVSISSADSKEVSLLKSV